MHPKQAKHTDGLAPFHSIPPVTDTDADPSPGQYLHAGNENNLQTVSPCASLEFVDDRHYDTDCNPVAPLEQPYHSSTPYLADAYSVNSHADPSLQHSGFDYQASLSDVFTYGEAMDPSTVSPLDNAVQSVETFVTYA